ncbi:MAG TPA: glycosyltransferase [Candidatus Melainabacteria bacterium]|nr:glycosyltransferase [Candidatus Melainabacteria bacterium]HIN66396.1 glycosyltransferase [Candidatus Obscuribacterales bacterium]
MPSKTSRKPRVLVFIVQYPNFSETYMHEELRNLAEYYDVHIITYKKSPFPRRETFNYTLIEYQLPCFVYYPYEQVDWELAQPESVRFLASVEEVIREFKPDILHGHYFGLTILLQHLAEIHKLPFTVRTHSMDVLREPAVKLEKLCALSNSAWCAGILAMPQFRQRLTEHGLAESKLVDCFPLINFEKFYKPEKREKTGKIICAGPSSPKKAHKDFVDLALMMKEAGSTLDFDLYTDGYTLQDTVQYNDSKGKPVRIMYVDPDEMPEIYAQYDWLVYPADPKINRVGFPVGMVEAQASGLGVLWQELPDRKEEQLKNLQGAGILYKSIKEVPELLMQPYPEEMRQKGFERAKLCSAKEQSHLLTDCWDRFAQQREMIEKPAELVSVIISYFEKPADLCQSVTSALNQTYENLEVIVVDDASSQFPATSILSAQLLSRVRLITHEKNRGVSAARNTAIQASSGTFIVPLDADDLLHKEFVMRCVQAAVAGRLDAVYTQMQWFGDSEYLMTPKANLVNLLCHKEGFPTLLYHRKVFDKIGGYREDMPIGSDHQFLLSVAAEGFALARIEGALWLYNKNEKGLGSIDVEKRMSNLISSNGDLYEKHWPEVIARLDSYYLSLYDEYHRARKASNEQVSSLTEELDRYRIIHQEYVKVLAAYERLVDESSRHAQALDELNRLQRETQLQRQLISDLKNNLDAAISAPNTAPFIDQLKANVRSLKMKSQRRQSSISADIELIEKSGIFDESYYRKQCRRKNEHVVDPVVHFLEKGCGLNFNPSPLFDLNFYRQQLTLRRINYPGNPLVHFIEQGARLGIPTSPFFDTDWYISNYSDVKESGQNPLAHFILFGAAEGRHSTVPGANLCTDLRVEGEKGSTSKKQAEETASVLVKSDEKVYDVIIGLHEASRTGAPLVGLELARGLKKRGITPLIFLPKTGALLPDLAQDFDIIDLSQIVEQQSALLNHIDRLEAEGRLSSNTIILNSAEMHPFHSALKQRQMRVVTLFHEFLSLYPHHTRESLRRHSDLAIFSCQQILADAQKHCAGPWTNFEVISQGLIDSQFGRRIEKDEAIKELVKTTGARIGDFIVLACGTAEMRKGIDIFVQVAKTVIGRFPKTRFVWIGGSHAAGSDPLTWATRDAEQSTIKDRVHFLDTTENIEPLFSAADLFLLPSRLDPLPCVVHQAMACSLPVVAFQGSGGVEEILQDGGGQLVNYLDVPAMADSISQYIENPDVRLKDGALAAKIVMEKYNFESYVDTLIEHTGVKPKAPNHATSDKTLVASH